MGPFGNPDIADYFMFSKVLLQITFSTTLQRRQVKKQSPLMLGEENEDYIRGLGYIDTVIGTRSKGVLGLSGPKMF